MTGCSPRHLAANRSYQDHSQEGNSRCRNVNRNNIIGCIFFIKFTSLFLLLLYYVIVFVILLLLDFIIVFSIVVVRNCDVLHCWLAVSFTAHDRYLIWYHIVRGTKCIVCVLVVCKGEGASGTNVRGSRVRRHQCRRHARRSC